MCIICIGCPAAWLLAAPLPPPPNYLSACPVYLFFAVPFSAYFVFYYRARVTAIFTKIECGSIMRQLQQQAGAEKRSRGNSLELFLTFNICITCGGKGGTKHSGCKLIKLWGSNFKVIKLEIRLGKYERFIEMYK